MINREDLALLGSPIHSSTTDRDLFPKLEDLKRIPGKVIDKTWKQYSFPVSLGGLGVRSAVDVSLPAFDPK